MSKLLTVTRNTKGIDYAVGDIHGCFNLVDHALEAIGFDPKKDRLFGVGDLTDRGPQSHRATHYLNQPWFFSVMGNHDALACTVAKKRLNGTYHERSKDVDIFMDHGGEWIRERTDEELEDIVRIFSGLPIAIEYRDEDNQLLAGLVHAQLDDELQWGEFTEILRNMPHDFVYSLDVPSLRGIHNAMWGRSKWLSYRYSRTTDDFRESWYTSEGAPLVISGHNVVEQENDGPVKMSNNLLIDHGMVFNRVGGAKIYKMDDLLKFSANPSTPL